MLGVKVCATRPALSTFFFSFSSQARSLIGLELTKLAWLAGQKALRICLSQTSYAEGTDVHPMSFPLFTLVQRSENLSQPSLVSAAYCNCMGTVLSGL